MSEFEHIGNKHREIEAHNKFCIYLLVGALVCLAGYGVGIYLNHNVLQIFSAFFGAVALTGYYLAEAYELDAREHVRQVNRD